MLDNNKYLENYMALLACILSPNLGVDRAVKIMTKPKRAKVSSKVKYKGVIVSNVKTGKEFNFNRIKHAATFVGVESALVSQYAIKQYKYNDTYMFRYLY